MHYARASVSSNVDHNWLLLDLTCRQARQFPPSWPIRPVIERLEKARNTTNRNSWRKLGRRYWEIQYKEERILGCMRGARSCCCVIVLLFAERDFHGRFLPPKNVLEIWMRWAPSCWDVCILPFRIFLTVQYGSNIAHTERRGLLPHAWGCLCSKAEQFTVGVLFEANDRPSTQCWRENA